MLLPKLYKLSTKNKTQEWTVEIDGGRYRTIAGQVGGTLTVSGWTDVEPKNVGRSNETSREEQAMLEARAKWDKKNDLDYHTNIERINESNYYSPMLAHKYKDQGHKLPETLLISSKMDGARIIIKKDGVFSRTGKRFPALDFFANNLLRPIFEKYPEAILDGEAYNHNLKDNFNKIISLCKKTTASAIEASREEVEKNIFPILFDVPVIGELNEKDPFKDRWAKLILEFYGDINPEFFVEYKIISKSDIDKQHEIYISEGYEGSMLRDPGAPYENKRSYTLQKKKDFREDEFKIVEILEGKGNRAGMAGKIRLIDEKGETFKATSMGDESLFRDMFLHPENYVGKMATVKFMNLTPPPEEVPRHANIKSIRNYE